MDDQLAYLADEEYGRRGMIFFFWVFMEKGC